MARIPAKARNGRMIEGQSGYASARRVQTEPPRLPIIQVWYVFHYQMMLSESWVVGCYEILRAVRQRDDDGNLGADGVSALATFRSIFADLELLRMPIAKYEIAKDNRMKQPLTMRAISPNKDTTDNHVYDKKDPARSHIMPIGISGRGSMMWLVLDHSNIRGPTRSNAPTQHVSGSGAARGG